LKQITGFVPTIPDDRAAEMPAGIRNHPAWTLTHLCVASDFSLQATGEASKIPQEWFALTGPGSVPVLDRGVYPSLHEALATLTSLHEKVSAALAAKPMSFYDEPSPELLRAFLPTNGQLVTFMLCSHEPNHLGQLLAWRRAAGLAN